MTAKGSALPSVQAAARMSNRYYATIYVYIPNEEKIDMLRAEWIESVLRAIREDTLKQIRPEYVVFLTLSFADKKGEYSMCHTKTDLEKILDETEAKDYKLWRKELMPFDRCY